MDSPCIKQTVCKVFKIFQCGKYLIAYVLNPFPGLKNKPGRIHCPYQGDTGKDFFFKMYLRSWLFFLSQNLMKCRIIFCLPKYNFRIIQNYNVRTEPFILLYLLRPFDTISKHIHEFYYTFYIYIIKASSKIEKRTKIRNRLNQLPYLTRNTIRKRNKNTRKHKRVKRSALSQQVTKIITK